MTPTKNINFKAPEKMIEEFNLIIAVLNDNDLEKTDKSKTLRKFMRQEIKRVKRKYPEYFLT